MALSLVSECLVVAGLYLRIGQRWHRHVLESLPNFAFDMHSSLGTLSVACWKKTTTPPKPKNYMQLWSGPCCGLEICTAAGTPQRAGHGQGTGRARATPHSDTFSFIPSPCDILDTSISDDDGNTNPRQLPASTRLNLACHVNAVNLGLFSFFHAQPNLIFFSLLLKGVFGGVGLRKNCDL